MVKMINGGGRFQEFPNHMITDDSSRISSLLWPDSMTGGAVNLRSMIVTDLRRVNLDL